MGKENRKAVTIIWNGKNCSFCFVAKSFGFFIATFSISISRWLITRELGKWLKMRIITREFQFSRFIWFCLFYRILIFFLIAHEYRFSFYRWTGLSYRNTRFRVEVKKYEFFENVLHHFITAWQLWSGPFYIGSMLYAKTTTTKAVRNNKLHTDLWQRQNLKSHSLSLSLSR